MKYITLYNNFKIKVNNFYDKNKGGRVQKGDLGSPLQFYNVTL